MNAYKIRQATGKDLHFIYDTWLQSFRYDSPLGKSCRNSIFFNEYKLVVDRILSEAETLVAHDPGDENLVFAYLTYQLPNILHYAFCKKAFWRLGITKSLFTQAFGSPDFKVDATHRTATASEIFREKHNITHNPFHLYLKGAI